MRILGGIFVIVVALGAAMAWLANESPKPNAMAATPVSQPPNHNAVSKEKTQTLNATSSSKPTMAKPYDKHRLTLDQQAIQSLREARLQGDPRTPPMMQNPPERKMPTDEQLADPDKYAEYEKSQRMQVYQQFIYAVPQKVTAIENALKRAKKEGAKLTKEQMQFAKDKMASLKAMKEKLLHKHSELVGTSATMSNSTKKQVTQKEASKTP